MTRNTDFRRYKLLADLVQCLVIKYRQLCIYTDEKQSMRHYLEVKFDGENFSIEKNEFNKLMKRVIKSVECGF